MDPIRCRHCGTELVTDREKFIHVCYGCRRTGLLTGHWPEDLPTSKDSFGQPEPSHRRPGLISEWFGFPIQ
jgi:hypothetical protein